MSIFLFDSDFMQTRARRLEALRAGRRADDLLGTGDLDPAAERLIARFIVEHLVREHPDAFLLEQLFDGSGTLHCKPSRELLTLDSEFNLIELQTPLIPPPRYRSVLEALLFQIQESGMVESFIPESDEDVEEPASFETSWNIFSAGGEGTPLQLERETLCWFPEAGIALRLRRAYEISREALMHDSKRQTLLREALSSMNPAVLGTQGRDLLSRGAPVDQLLTWLKSHARSGNELRA